MEELTDVECPTEEYYAWRAGGKGSPYTFVNAHGFRPNVGGLR